MPIDRVCNSLPEAIHGIFSGATILVGGFGRAGIPLNLLEELVRTDVTGLTFILNGAQGDGVQGRFGRKDVATLIGSGRVRKVVVSFPVPMNRQSASALEAAWSKGNLDVEIVPQGTLAERIRAGGAGIAGFFTPTGVSTPFEKGKEKRTIQGREQLLEWAIKSDFALIKAHKADRMGNLVFWRSARNFNPIMATAAKVTIAEVDEIVEPGGLDPEEVITPGIYVNRVVQVPAQLIQNP